MTEEWGPWIEHDGAHQPSNGVLVEKEYANGLVLIGMVGARAAKASELGVPFYPGECFASSWLWFCPGPFVPIVRYRVRKPKGMTILENLVATLDAQEGPVRIPGKVDA